MYRWHCSVTRVFTLAISLTLLLVALPILAAANGVFAAQQSTPLPTNTPRATAIPTNTPRALPTQVIPTATETPIPTATFTAAPTLTPSETPTLTPTEAVFLPTPTLYYPPDFEPRQDQPTAIPTAMPRLRSVDENGNPYEILNVLLLGNDGIVDPGQPFHTDTMIVVSINRNTNTVSMVSLPRDLFVFIPNWGMARLNLAWGYGESIGWTDGAWGMMRQTLLYNFGLETHYYAMVDFDGFETIIDRVGGVTIAVDCPIQDEMCQTNCDDGVAGNETYALQTIPVGVHQMDSELALWYARSRKNTIDFDRGRRQQQILRAIWAQSKTQGLITQLPQLYSEMTSVVQTNMPLEEIIPLIPLALNIQPNDIENHFFRKNIETIAWSPDGTTNVQLPEPNGGMLRLIENFLAPPTQNRLRLENARIEIFNGSSTVGWDMVAADRLVWEGFAPAAMGQFEQTDFADTVIYDFTGTSKGSSLNELIKLLNIKPENIIAQPEPNRTADFRIILGANYNSCVDRQWVAPE
ncbi:MAG: LCP family protein [Chloroflexi bacterium]|nr:LCP family protein [Chloroflexota bacterium]